MSVCVIIGGNISIFPAVRSNNSSKIIQPIAAVLAVVLRGPNILLVQRANRPDAGLWGFPGGKIEAGETRFDAARRELREETEVSAEPFRLLAELDAFDHDDDGRLTQHFVMAAVACRWISGEPIAGDDALQARWVPSLQLDSAGLQFSKDVLNVARMAIEASRN